MLLLSCAARQPGDPLRAGYNVFSVEQDIALGKEAAGEIRQQVDIVKDPQLQQYVARLGARLAEQPEAEQYPYEFTLINEPSINAFALPGGPIFIHSGLLTAADTEGELVGVLAHEISHVVLRHGTSQASKAQMIQLPAVLAGAVIGQDSMLAQLGQLGLGLGVNSLIMKYSRSAEKQADALGARIMAGAGFDPTFMASFFQKLEAQGGPRPPTLLSSHPSPGNRVELVKAEMATFPAGNYGYQTGEFPRAKTEIAKLPAPKRPQQAPAVAAAQVAPPAPPRGGVNSLDWQGVALAYPAGWKAYGGSGAQVVTLAPERGLVRNPQGAVSLAYGAVISRYQSRAQTLGTATRELISELQSMNSELQVSGGPRAVYVQDSPALVVNMSSRSPYGGAERDVLLTIARPEGIFYIVFVGPERGFDQLGPAFEGILGSIRFR